MTKSQLLREFKRATKSYLRAKDNSKYDSMFDEADFYDEYRREIAQELKEKFDIVIA